MAIGGRIECTNHATTCHRLATTEIDGRPYCPSCAAAIDRTRRGYVRSRYNEDPAQAARWNARLVISQPHRQQETG
jgi:hypothetical protein